MAPKVGRSKKARNLAYTQVPTLEVGQAVMRVAGVRGNNLYDVHHFNGKDLHILVLELPKRLRQGVYIRPGCYVFARLDPSRGAGSIVKGDIEEIILDKFLGTLEKAAFWPAAFAKNNNTTKVDEVVDSPLESKEVQVDGDRNENEEEEELDDDWIGQGNPNRASWLEHEESSSSEDSGEEEEQTVKK